MAIATNSNEMAILLSREQVEHYEREGYLIVRSVFSEQEVSRLGEDVSRVCEERCETIHPDNLRVRFKNCVDSQAPVFEVLDPISDLSVVASEMTLDPRIMDRLQCLYGEPACLFKDKLIYKPAGTEGATLHQDWIGWPGFPESFLTVLIAIDPFNEADGATAVYPRQHSQGYLSQKDGQHHYLEHSAMDTEPVHLELDAGDIAIFSCFTPHFSNPNRSEHSRRGFFISYNALSDGGPQYQRHYSEFHDWIRARYPVERRQQLVFQ
jgi:2-aminoethylphosphonate dioxygenase